MIINRLRKKINAIRFLGDWSKENGASDVRLIGNGLPKSGTYLLNAILSYFGMWRDTRMHLFNDRILDLRNEKAVHWVPVDVVSAVDYLQQGQISSGHIQYRDDFARKLDMNTDMKHIVMVRDPRDVFMSYLKYASNRKSAYRNNPSNRRRQDLLLDFLPGDDERLLYVMVHYMEHHDFLAYAQWRDHAGTLFLRFEDLYTDMLKAADGVTGETLSSLLDYAGIDRAGFSPKEMAGSVLGKSRTASGNSKKIGRYKEVFSAQHLRLVESEYFREILRVMGYEK